MILLLTTAAARSVLVCNAPQLCDHYDLGLAIADLSDELGPHEITVSGVHVLNSAYALSRDYTIIGTPGADITVGLSGRLTVNGGNSLTMTGFGIGFLPLWSGRLFEANGPVTLQDIVFRDVDVDTDGALVYVNSSGSAQLTNVDIAPTLGAQFTSKSAFHVNGGATLSIDGGTFDKLFFTNGHLFQLSGGTVTTTDLVIDGAASGDRGVLARLQSNASLTMEGGTLGPGMPDPTFVALGDGGLFRVEGSELTLRNLSIGSIGAGNGGIAWANGNSTLVLQDVDVSGVAVIGDGGLIEQSGGTMSWTGGTVSGVTSNGGGAFHLTGGSHTLDGVLFSSMVGVTGPAIADASAPLTVSGVTVASAMGSDTAIHASGDLTVQDSVFSGGSGAEAGFLWVDGAGVLEITNTTFEGGTCTAPAGATAVLIEAGRSGTISGSLFDHNGGATVDCRGALFLDGEVVLSDTSFVGNQTVDVGAIELDNAAAIFQGPLPNIVSHNEGLDAAFHGKGDAVLGALGHPFQASFEYNTGGAMRFDADTTVYLGASSFRFNDAQDSAGGAIRTGLGSSLFIEDSTFTSNQSTAARGGAIAAEGGAAFEVLRSDFVSNSAELTGGAIYVDVDGAIVDTCSFVGNSTATSHGGALYFGNTIEVLRSSFSGNTAANFGGAIGGQSASTLFLSDSELRGNDATGNVGGVYLANDSFLTAYDTVFALNSSVGNRGAVMVNSGGTVDIQRSLFCGNSSAALGKAIFGNASLGGLVEHSWFVGHDPAPVAFSGLDGDLTLRQNTFWGAGTAVDITDGSSNIDIVIERSLFGGFTAGDRPVQISGLDAPDGATFADSMLDPAGYLLPTDTRVAVSGLVDEDPQLVNPTVDCATATFEDFAAGPLSTAWTRVDEDDHWGAYLPAWGVNTDDDASPALWDCVDGDQDTDPAYNREALDVCSDGLDQDCDGVPDDGCVTLFYPDDDHDGYGDASATGSETQLPGWVTDNSDCDDSEATVSPVGVEVCNGVDDDCDTELDEGFPYEDIVVDLDGDLHGVDASGCPGSGVAVPVDDCDDTNAGVHPGAVEICGNGIDENCSGQADETQTWFADADGDGYGDASASIDSCEPPSGHVADDTDCDDTSGAVHPGATEVCNGFDDDCVGGIDDGLPTYTSYLDHDGDGYALDTATAVVDCRIPAGNTEALGDCDDDDATTYTGAQEQCDTVDHDCDGDPNPVGTPTWYTDADGDGYGAGVGIEDCVQPAGTVGNATDCDDTLASVNPAADEICDGLDNDCVGGIDDGLPVLSWYRDTDGDGYGAGAPTLSCDGLQDPARVPVGGDCNDQNAQLSPGAQEVCDQIDNDCDGNVDDQDDDVVDGTIYYLVDNDGDGSGAITAGPSCNVPSNALTFGPDCDDTNEIVYTGAPENCADGVDNDCDGLIDADDPDFIDGALTYWPDQDGDGYGDQNDPLESCGLVAGYVLGGAQLPDCDDALFSVNPAADEVCDGVDNNCNGAIDGADVDPPPSDGTLLYSDTDGDGFGSGLLLIRTCDPSQPLPFTSVQGGDCDDDEADVNPGATEDCSDLDLDCSGDPYDGEEIYYGDADGDGFGDPLVETTGCYPDDPSWAQNADDCDDSTDTIYPGAPELCDAVDQDCDGDPWEGDELVWQVDRDCDGVLGELAISCDPADIPDLGTCDPVVHDGSDPVFDCDDADPDVQVCEGRPPSKPVAQTGCGCNAGGSGSWLGLLVLLHGMRKRRPGRERRVG